jgi:hypothetical protein
MSASKASTARRFLIDQVTMQAQREGIALSALETKMLGFSEEGATDGEMASARQFEEEINDCDYEAKIADLLKHAYRDAQARGEAQAWNEALADLAERDSYIMVMADRAGIWNSSLLASLIDWRLLKASIPILCFVAAAFTLAFTPLGARLIPNVVARCTIFFLLLIAPWVIGKIGERKDTE